jgi:outer membrane protein assembly factor BamB
MRRVLSIICLGIALTPWAIAASPTPWPEFRGPLQNGYAAVNSHIPLTWSETENVVWKTAIPYSGWSSPVIEQDVLWMTSATPEGTAFYAIGVDAASGEIVYNEQLFTCEAPEDLGNTVNGYASPTSAIGDGRLYVHFGIYGTACIDTQTKQVLWKREDLECRHYRGPGSSVVLYKELVILTFDGVDQQYVIALDSKTGKTVWRRDRSTKWDDFDENGQPKREGDMRKAFSTPILAEVNGEPLLISVGGCSIFGYDPNTGKEIWAMATPGFTPSIRPVLYKNLTFAALGYGTREFRALRFDGQGALGEDHVAWKLTTKAEVPDTASPVVVDGLIYVLSDRGMMTCLDAETGEVIWSERIGGNYMASTLYANGYIYCFSKQGTVTVLKPGRTFTVVNTIEMDEGFMASPAVHGNALYLRTTSFLYRIEE